MQIVRAELSDIDAIMACIADAQRFLARLGVDQWQDGYPTREIIEQDILRGESFVMTEDGEVIATAVISFAGEPTYSVIEGSCVRRHRLQCYFDDRRNHGSGCSLY